MSGALTPERRIALIEEWEAGELSDALLCAKYGLNDYQLKTVKHIGRGSIPAPQPLERKGRKKALNGCTEVVELAAAAGMTDGDLQLSPLEEGDLVEPEVRTASLYLSPAELSFANMVLRGINGTAAAAACFEIFNKHMADKKAAELLRSSHVSEYMQFANGKRLFAPVRNKAYAVAVLWQIVDRSRELTEVFDSVTGLPVAGKCEYDPKTALAALALLGKFEGWEKESAGNGEVESQRDRLRRLQANFKESEE